MSVALERFDAARLVEELPYPARDANKYTRGKLTVIGGSDAYPGSVCLASKAALFAGAGYVECACSPTAVPLVRAFAPSLVVRSWEDASAASLGLAEAPRHPQGCLVGSGMVADGSFQDALVEGLVSACAVPLVMDGGALRTVADKALGESLRKRAQLGRITLLTPHGGEAAALAQAVGIAVPATHGPYEEQASFAQALADAYRACILLKGPVSFIASEGSATVFLMDQGTSALAKAGTGDVLAGVVGSFLAQGMDAVTASVLGATVHAEAGRIAAQSQGIISVTAEDALEALPQALQSL